MLFRIRKWLGIKRTLSLRGIGSKRRGLSIQILSADNKTLVKSTPFGCFAFSAYFILFFLASLHIDIADQLLGPDLLEFLDADQNIGPRGALILRATIIAIGLLIGIVAVFRSFLSLWDYLIWTFFSNVNIFYLFKLKIYEDLDSSDINSIPAIRDGILESKVIVSEIAKKQNTHTNKWIDNRIVWELDDKILENETLQVVTQEYSGLMGATQKGYENQIEDIKRLKSSVPDGCLIEFYVALVQPAFYLAMKEIVEETGIDDLFILKSDTQTGPETIERCVELAVGRPNSNKTIYSFVAPLFAYSLLEFPKPGSPVVSYGLKKRITLSIQRNILILLFVLLKKYNKYYI